MSLEFKPNISVVKTNTKTNLKGGFNPDLSLLFNAAFGLTGRLISFPDATNKQGDKQPSINYPNIEQVSLDEAKKQSHLGTAILMPVEFKGGNYNVYNRDGDIVSKPFKTLLLHASTLVDFSRDKIKSRTRINGSNFSVTESYGHDDWQINMRGILLDIPGTSTTVEKSYLDQHNDLLEYEEIVDAIELVSSNDLFHEKGIDSIEINSISFTQIQGFPRALAFTIDANSTESIELILK